MVLISFKNKFADLGIHQEIYTGQAGAIYCLKRADG